MRRHFDLLLHAAACDQSRIQAAQNFTQRQWNQHAIAVALGRKEFGRARAQFSKGNPHRSARKLGKDFFQRHVNIRLANDGLLDTRL
jgi:predicted SnoaL-like aldol condensation-catalyzing enzyme